MVEFKVLFLILALAGTLAADARAEIRDVLAKIKPSVVIVGSFKSTDSPRFRLRGTGFIVGNGNTVVTNAHVLPSDSENMTDTSLVVQVRISDRELQMRQAEVLEVDKVHDLALLRFQGAAAPAVPIRDSDSVREGQPVAFMGFPIGGALGFSPVTHRGMISSIVPSAMPTPNARLLNEQSTCTLHCYPEDGGDICSRTNRAYLWPCYFGCGSRSAP